MGRRQIIVYPGINKRKIKIEHWESDNRGYLNRVYRLLRKYRTKNVLDKINYSSFVRLLFGEYDLEINNEPKYFTITLNDMYTNYKDIPLTFDINNEPDEKFESDYIDQIRDLYRELEIDTNFNDFKIYYKLNSSLYDECFDKFIDDLEQFKESYNNYEDQ